MSGLFEITWSWLMRASTCISPRTKLLILHQHHHLLAEILAVAAGHHQTEQVVAIALRERI
jgi:hypothetical protein